MRNPWRFVATAAMVISGLSFGIAAESVGVQRLHVGATGIHCYKAPCLRLGIFSADSSLKTRKRDLLYAATSETSGLPRIEGSETDRRAIEAAWRAQQCIAVDGVFGLETGASVPVLHVIKLVGAC